MATRRSGPKRVTAAVRKNGVTKRKGARKAPKRRAAPVATQPLDRGGERGRPLRVRATRPGYYNLMRIRVGNVFTLSNPRHFSEKWMERVNPETPEHVTTSQHEIDRQHDEIRGLRDTRRDNAMGSGMSPGMETADPPTGDEDVLLGK